MATRAKELSDLGNLKLDVTANGIDVVGVGSNFKSESYNILNVQTDTNDNGSSDDGIFKITNGSAGTTKAEFRWDESEDLVHVSYGDHGRHISIDSDGNVGISTGSTAPGTRLHVARSTSDNAQRTIYADGTQLSAITTSGTNYLHNVWIENHNFDIDSGVTDSGYRIGLNIEGYHDSNVFEGTLATQKNIWSRNGNNSGGTGTITNSYNLHLETLSGGGITITNNYGLYQTGTGTKNYFQGDVGIGTNNPLGKFVVSNSGAEGIEFFPSASSGVNTTQHYNRSGSAYVKNRTIALNHEWVNGSTDPAMNLIPDGNSTFLVIKAKAGTFNSTANLSLYGTNPNINGGSLVSRATIQAVTDGTAFGTKLRLLTNNTSNVETKAITIDAAQNVGIGTDSPSETLHIYQSSANADVKIEAASAGDDSRLFIRRNNSSSRAYLQYSDATSSAVWYTGLLRNTTNIFAIGQGDDFGSNTRLCIDNGGSVGIGDTNPGAKLDVNGAIKLSGSGNGQEVQFVGAQAGSFSTVTIELQFPGAGSYNYEVGVSGTSGCGIQFGGGYTNGVSNFSHTGNQQVGSAWSVTSPSSNLVRLVSPSGAVGTHPTAYVKARFGLSDGFEESDISITFS